MKLTNRVNRKYQLIKLVNIQWNFIISKLCPSFSWIISRKKWLILIYMIWHVQVLTLTVWRCWIFLYFCLLRSLFMLSSWIQLKLYVKQESVYYMFYIYKGADCIQMCLCTKRHNQPIHDKENESWC